MKKAEIRKLATVHTLRHSFIHQLLMEDVSIAKLSVLVGHSSVQQTMDYTRLLVEDMRDLILRHPMTSKNRNPYDILNNVKDNINKFHLKEDSRFMYNIEEGNDGVRISIFIR